MHSDSDNEKTFNTSNPFRKNELVENLFITIENIVAGTANVSMKILSKSLLEWKIELLSNSSVIILQHESKCEENENVRMIPVLDYKIMDEKSGADDRNNVIHESNASSGKGNSSPSFDFKQNIPELLLVLKDELKKDENIDENKTEAVSTETNIGNGTVSRSICNYNEGVSSPSGRRLTDVAAYHSNTASLQTEEVEEQHRNYDDEINKIKSDGTGNDNGIGRREGKAIKRKNVKKAHKINTTMKTPKMSVKKKHRRLRTREKPCISNTSGKHVTPSHDATEKNNHTVEKSFTCEECGKCFTLFQNLHRHKKIHTGEKPYECEICGKFFIQVSHLKTHKRIHTGDKPYECEICGKLFIQVSHLNRHKRIHTCEKPYECEICGKSFNQVSHLNVHKRIHTGKKPYDCEICGKSFNQISHLNMHIKVHTGEKPYECEVCEKSFSRASHLKGHKRIHE